MRLNEEDLTIKIKKGNLLAFEEIYFEYQPRLYAFCRKFVNSSEQAKDIVQEIFLHFWEQRSNINIQKSLKSYLFQMVHNRCLNYIRDQKIKEKYSISVDLKIKEAEINFYDQFQEGYKSIFFQDINLILSRSIQELPEKCREIFVLSRIEGFSNKEIADKLDVSVRTVENQIYRALRILKEDLKDYLILFPFLISLLK